MGKESTFFQDAQSDNHVNSETQPEEILDYFHVSGCPIIHCGRHWHGATAATSVWQVNLLLWCISNSVFCKLKKYQRDCSSWCIECQREKKKRHCLSIAATKQELLKRLGTSAA